jgi:hypothetical protein
MAKQFGKKAGGLSGSGRASEGWIDEELAGMSAGVKIDHIAAR